MNHLAENPQSSTTAGRTRDLAMPGFAAFIVLCYLPLITASPGKVVADTKSYLYIDPGRLLASAASMWDPKIGLGTSSHQSIGYLFPMGPYYWLTHEALGIPAWLSQRIWLGTLLLAAGFGMRYLLRTLSITGPGLPVAMLAYAFSPYALEYSSRLSVLLGPWAALPWFMAIVIRGVRHGGWKYPAIFALVIQLVGSVNASSLIFALIGPALWFPYAVFVQREVRLRDGWTTAWRMAVLTVLTSLWWISGLWVEGKYGLNILRFTESIKTVSATSFPYEVLRGLGYWFFYGRDRIGLWNDAFLVYSLNGFVIFASMAIPAVALFNAIVVRWRHQVFFAALTLVGVAIAVAASPYDNPSPLGRIFKSFATTSTAGFAMRSTARATPLVAMSLAVCLAAGLSAFAAHARSRGRARLGVGVAAVLATLCLTNAAGAWNQVYYSSYLERDEQLPAYWTQALRDLNAKGHDTRVLALPGSDFAAYRWGNTIDPIEPGLLDRPYVARELVPWGSEPTANFLNALDRRLQELSLDPESVAPIARLMAVGDIALRMDLETDRFGIAPAEITWATMTQHGLPGTQPAKRYGSEIPGSLTFPVFGDLARPPSQDVDPPPVATIAVDDAQPIVRARSNANAIVLSGDGEGMLDAAAAGLIDGKQLVLYSASYANAPTKLQELPDDTLLIITDSNRKRALRWAGMTSNNGYTETATEMPMRDDPLDQRLVVFPDQRANAQTVTEYIGARRLQATGFGAPWFGYSSGDRPVSAFDGDRDTAWQVDNGEAPSRHRLVLELTKKTTTDNITFVQPEGRKLSRFVSKVKMRFDDGEPVFASLNASSREDQGQRVSFSQRSFSKFELTIEDTSERRGRSLFTKNPIGFSEIQIPDSSNRGRPVVVGEASRVPSDLLTTLGATSATHPLVFVLTKETAMDSRSLIRRINVPTARDFVLTGTTQLSTFAKDDAIDRTFGLRDADHGGVTATSTKRLGDPIARASSALDGNPRTAWNTPAGDFKDVSMTFRAAQPIDLASFDLEVIADGRHSIPTELTLTSKHTRESRIIKLPRVVNVTAQDGVIKMPVRFPVIRDDTFTITVTGFQPVEQSGTAMPVGLAELGVPGVRRDPLPDQLPSTCHRGLLEIDGSPVGVRVTGSARDAEQQRPLQIATCDGKAISLAAGDHELRTLMNPHNPNSPVGLDVRRIVLSSGANGIAATPQAVVAAHRTVAPSQAAPALNVRETSRTAMHVSTTTSTSPYWLVLGQSINAGWVAKVDGKDLGPSQLVDGYANGWVIPPSATAGQPVTITIEWTPQRVVRYAIFISVVACLACVGIIVVAARRRTGTVAAFPNDRATWHTPTDVDHGHLTPSIGIAVCVAFALLGYLLAAPWVGMFVGVMVAFALRNRYGQLVLKFLPGAIVLSVAAYMAGGQLLERYPPRFEWPTYFESARMPTWIALLAFAAHATIANLKTRRAGDDGPPATPEDDVPDQPAQSND